MWYLSNRLFMQALHLLVHNKVFIILPFISVVLSLSAFILLGCDIHWINASNGSYANAPQYNWYLQLGLFLVLLFFIIGINTFVSASIVYIASFNLLGKTVSCKEAFQQCWLQRNALLSWGIFFLCAGFILSLLSRAGKIDKLIFSTANAGWHICAFLMMPYLIIEKLTPSAAFEKSSQYFVSSAVFQVNILLLLGLYLVPLIASLYLAQQLIPLGYQEIVKDILFYGVIALGFVWLIWGNAFNSIIKTAFYLKIKGKNELLFLKKEDVGKIIQ